MGDIFEVSIADTEYPMLLRETADPPSVLYIRGNVRAVSHAMPIAVVGTRKPTRYGLAATDLLAGGLAQMGVSIVSGLALGTDAAAHAAALRAGGVTVAVLAGGVDVASVGPPSNRPLAERIIASGGALVSEHPPGTITFPSEFLRRNRIIAGLCRGTIVVEAAVKSGALVTAREALQNNRDVFAVPGQITSPLSEGTNALLARGAAPAVTARGVLEQVGMWSGAAFTDEGPVPCTKMTSPEDVKLLALLAREEMSADELSLKTGIAPRDLLSRLTLLEISGLITAAGGRYGTTARTSSRT